MHHCNTKPTIVGFVLQWKKSAEICPAETPHAEKQNAQRYWQVAQYV